MSTGYVVATFDLKNLEAWVPGHDGAIALMTGGIMTPDTMIPVTSQPAACAPEVGEGKAVLVTLEYEERDAVTGLAGEGVKHLTLATIQDLSFMNTDDHLKYGHILNPNEVQLRRSAFRGESLVAGEFPRKYVVLRAMSHEATHIFPMDYTYVSTGSVTKSISKRVIDAYLSGDRSKILSSTEKSLMLALDHATTIALSHSEPQHVTVAVVDNRNLYKAVNHGEFFYDSVKPMKIVSLIDVSAHGVPSLAATIPAKQRMLSSPL